MGIRNQMFVNAPGIFPIVAVTRVTLTFLLILPQKSVNLKKLLWLVGSSGHGLCTEITTIFHDFPVFYN